MDTEVIQVQKQQLILEDGSAYFYTIQAVEITNTLGAVAAVLNEYFITSSTGETYKLYKTKEGNWYDVPEVNAGANTSILMAFKMAFHVMENGNLK